MRRRLAATRDFGFIAEQNGEIIGAARARPFSAEEVKFHCGDDETPKGSIGAKPNAVVRGYRIPSPCDHDDVPSERRRWQIYDGEIFDRGAISSRRFRDPLTLLFGSF
jgi:hypothetical protein